MELTTNELITIAPSLADQEDSMSFSFLFFFFILKVKKHEGKLSLSYDFPLKSFLF